jgi:hypothetical protein
MANRPIGGFEQIPIQPIVIHQIAIDSMLPITD